MNKLLDSNSISVNLDQYDQELIHAPGYIQPHGVLIVLDKKNLNILQISENTEQFFGVTAQSLINQEITKLFPVFQVKKIRKYISNNGDDNIHNYGLKIKLFNKSFQAVIHQGSENLILELESQELTNNKSINLTETIRTSIYQLKKATNISELSQYLAENIKDIIHFDRVMIYQFKEDNSGVVIAEAKENHLESYLNLHYPEFDIPEVARRLYRENWLRIIPDVNYQPIPIIPNSESLDLSPTFLRSVSPCHLTYLKNMGVTASMSISLIHENKLWGLIACHHYSPKYIDYETRKNCEFLGQFLSLQTKVIQEQELRQYLHKIDQIKTNIREQIRQYPSFINDLIKAHEPMIIDLVHSQGMAIILGKQVILSGKTPDESLIINLVNQVLKPEKKEVFYTDCLSQIYPEAEQFKTVASGILAISIFLSTTSYHLIWFRPEQRQTKHWAGNPEAVFSQENPDNIPILSPRNSFKIWQETVKNKSLSWQKVEIEAAQELRTIILLAALEFSQISHELLEENAKQAEAANQAKTQFLAKMSHELRTPLNAILGFSHILSRDFSLSVQQRDYLDIINHSGEYLLSLINDVLEMSKIEAGQLKLNQNNFDFWELIKSIQEMFCIKASDQGLHLLLEQQENLPQYLLGDEAKIRQIIVNLVGNAIKFTEHGHVILRISQLTTKPQKIKVKIEVEDTGKGISPEELDLIFDPFKQAQNKNHSESGTGLGLSISQQFAHLMGGEITVTSQLNQGSIFTCILNLELSPPTFLPSQKTTQKVLRLASEEPIYRILVVEDVPENQKLMVHLLQSVGFQVNSAYDGLQAIALWQSWQPDLIFMDMRMPKLDGYEATRRIRQLELSNPELPSVSIVALTATVFEEERKDIFAVGCNDIVYKPFREEVLFEIINKHLRVQYVYENEPLKKNQIAFLQLNEVKCKLSLMPNEWREQLKEAAVSAREKNILNLIKQIPQEHFSLAQALNRMLDNLAFSDIINLTENPTNEEF